MKSNIADVQAASELVQAVLETLGQGETLLSQLNDEAYTRKLPLAFNASIGGHYRHCLDHFQMLLGAADSGDVNYDHRERGTAVETDRRAALAATRQVRGAFEALDASLLERTLQVTCQTSYGTLESQTCGSTVGRETMYAVAHAVHHYALIGIMAGVMGIELPAGFGVAPSTLKYQANVAAAA
jgi:uncharacterized damage-inducible protein DinB